MEKILCESIVYCDLLLIILLFVGLLIDNKAFVVVVVRVQKIGKPNNIKVF